jgi:hypothetical protein
MRSSNHDIEWGEGFRKQPCYKVRGEAGCWLLHSNGADHLELPLINQSHQELARLVCTVVMEWCVHQLPTHCVRILLRAQACCCCCCK